MPILFQKLVSSLPATLDADTIYAIRADIGFDLYITNSAGTVAHKINADPNKVDKVASTDNAIVRFDGTTGNVQNSSVTITDAGRVGIGTSTPLGRLQVGGANGGIIADVGNIATITDFSSYPDFSLITAWNKGNGATEFDFIFRRSSDSARVGGFRFYKTGTDGIIDPTPMLSVRADNSNVGIGIALPTEKLHVVGNALISGLAGTGTRLVTATSSGVLSSFASGSSVGDSIKWNGTGWATSPAVASTDNAIVRFDGTTGNVQNSSVTIDDDGYIVDSLRIRSNGIAIGEYRGSSLSMLSLFVTGGPAHKKRVEWRQDNSGSIFFHTLNDSYQAAHQFMTFYRETASSNLVTRIQFNVPTIQMVGLPTSPTGLPANTIWKDTANGNVLKIT